MPKSSIVSKLLAISITLGLAASLTSCAPAMTASNNAQSAVRVVRLPPIVPEALETATDAARALDENLLESVRRGPFKPPPTLDDAIESIPPGPLSKSEQQIAEDLKLVDEFFTQVNGVLAQADDWSLRQLPNGVIELVGLYLVPQQSAPFAAHVNRVTRTVLKGVMCTTLRDLLDEVGKQATAGSIELYTPLQADAASIEAFIEADLGADWNVSDVKELLDIAGIASASVKKVAGWVGAIDDIVTAPSLEMAGANLYYARACVFKLK